MNKKNIRLLAILLLDDQNGINDEAYEALMPLLHETNNQDIIDVVESRKGRNFISEEDAQILKERE